MSGESFDDEMVEKDFKTVERELLEKFQKLQPNEVEKKALLSGTNRMFLYGALGSITGSYIGLRQRYRFSKGLQFPLIIFGGMSGFFAGMSLAMTQSARNFITLRDSPMADNWRQLYSLFLIERMKLRLKHGKSIPWVFRGVNFENFSNTSSSDFISDEMLNEEGTLKETVNYQNVPSNIPKSSSWDEIRKKNQQGNNKSSWDRLREENKADRKKKNDDLDYKEDEDQE